MYVQYGGCSYCRVGCWRTFLGSKDLTDGVWVWPEGLAHYVGTHGVRLPDEFVAHARRHAFRAPGKAALPRLAWEHDWTFWNEWSRTHAKFDYEPNCLACAFPGDTLCSNALAFWRRLGRRQPAGCTGRSLGYARGLQRRRLGQRPRFRTSLLTTN